MRTITKISLAFEDCKINNFIFPSIDLKKHSKGYKRIVWTKTNQKIILMYYLLISFRSVLFSKKEIICIFWTKLQKLTNVFVPLYWRRHTGLWITKTKKLWSLKIEENNIFRSPYLIRHIELWKIDKPILIKDL